MAFDSFSDILATLRARFPQLSSRLNEAKAMTFWEQAVGPQIAKHARALRVQDGILWIEVDHPAWRSEIHHRKAQILEKIKVAAGAPLITDLYLTEPQRPRGPSRSGPLSR